MLKIKLYLIERNPYLRLFTDFKVCGFYTLGEVIIVTTSYGNNREEFYFDKEEFEEITGKPLQENLKIQRINYEVDLMNVKLRISERHQIIGELKIKQPII